MRGRCRRVPSRSTDALGCVLGEDVAADIDLPPFDKALVDGYAVRSDDLRGPDRRLRLGESIMAGQTPTRPLAPGEAAAIMTGAPLPPGCDAVVMHERTQADDGRASGSTSPRSAPGRTSCPAAARCGPATSSWPPARC